MDALDFIDGIGALAHPSEDLLYDLIHGRLSPGDQETVVDHLGRCPHCRELAEIFGWTSGAASTAEIVHLTGPIAPHARGAAPGRAMSRVAWRSAQSELLAAADAEAAIELPRASATGTNFVQLVPGATDGDAALGYLCGGGGDVVVTGAKDGPGRVVLAGAEYALREGTADEPRVVEGLTRKHVAVWLAGGRQGRFAIVYP